MINKDYIKLPRLYVDQELTQNTIVSLEQDQAHYLKNVLRRSEGDKLRVFNGRQGEWLVKLNILGKKKADAYTEKLLIEQPLRDRKIHLLFCPIKKARMDIMIEKAVELGVTHLHPLLSQNTEVRKINASRTNKQIIEAAEQCERLDIALLTDLNPLHTVLEGWQETDKIIACLERHDAPPFKDQLNNGDDIAILIGPEGGFTAEEQDMLSMCNNITTASLGTTILRSETASIVALSIISSHEND